MTLKMGKRDITKMAELLEGDFSSAETAAEAALGLAWDMYEAKAKFTVVGQLYSSKVDSTDPESAPKIALGRYGTEKQALEAARSLVFSTPTGETFRAWVLPVHHGSPHEYFQMRNKALKAKAIEEGGKQADWDDRSKFFDTHPGVLVTTTQEEK